MLGTRAVGHTGTLDPFATGLLVVLAGRATRLARFVESQPKTYLATARLGVRTDTDDCTGTALQPFAPPHAAHASGAGTPDSAAVMSAMASLVGHHRQRPPQYSAKQIAGERSYRLARRGEMVDLAEVPVTVHAIDVLEYHWPDVAFRATVSAGTYLRALARDLGERLGVGAHLSALRRESVGALRVDAAVALDGISTATLLPPERVLAHLPVVSLDAGSRAAVAHGRAVPNATGTAGAVALLHADTLIAVAIAADGWLRPAVVLGDA